MRIRCLLVALVLLAAPMAFAGNYSLNDWCFYVNSLDINHSCSNGSGTDNFVPPIHPGAFDYLHLADYNNTLGTVTVTVGEGKYNVFAVFDYDIALAGGLNEYATAARSLAIGETYTVGAAGRTPGSVYSQFASGILDDTNHASSCPTPGACEDIAASIGFTNVIVPSGSTGVINFIVSDTPPSSGFYISQTDTDSGNQLFISANLQLSSVNSVQSPEPGTIILMTGGFGAMLLGLRRRSRA
jgi:hypothetical protein